MRKIYKYIIPALFVLWLTGCTDEQAVEPQLPEKQVVLKLFAKGNITSRIIDSDNTAEEQTINNLSVFFTDPSSDAVTHQFVYSGFSEVSDYKLVTLPLDPATLGTKDIYVVANCDNELALNAVQTIDDLKLLTTSKVNKNLLLLPSNGIAMYGSTAAFDFNLGSRKEAVVTVVRTCAKYRLKLTFPDNSQLSSDNRFLIANAATYTYIIRNEQAVLTDNDYFTYASAIPLVDNGSQAYTYSAYVYEASRIPRLYFYTHADSSTDKREYSVDLPVPFRNYLYDILLEVYESASDSRTRTANSGSNASQMCRMSVNTYDGNGELVSYQSTELHSDKVN